MNDDKSRPSAPVDYKEHQIVLTSDPQGDETWICRYTILEVGQARLESGNGQSEGTFPSREAAELEALQKAKTVIDLRTLRP